MKLFRRTGGHWLFYISALYFTVGMWSIYKGVDLVWLPPLYILFLSMPFWFPPLGRSMNLDITWDQKMFDMFKKQQPEYFQPTVADPIDYGVDRNAAQPDPTVKEEDPKMNANAHYTVGINEHGRTQLRMQLDYGSATLTMNDQGTIDLIEDLAHTIRKRYRIEVVPLDNADLGDI